MHHTDDTAASRAGLRGWGPAVALCGLLAAANLVAGIAGGLARFGWSGPRGAPLALHGLLMVCGVFGTLLSLERAVALGRAWALLVPLAAGLGGVLAWSGAPVEQPLALWTAAAAGLLALHVWAAASRAHAQPVTMEMLAAACWLAGLLLWWQAGLSHEAMPAWMAFLVLSIAAEQRERMRRLQPTPAARGVFLAAVLLLPAAVLLALAEGLTDWPQRMAWTDVSARAWWSGCVLMGAWLLRHDPAPRQWSAPGWRGLSAQALTLGYGWLLVGGLLGWAERWWPMAAAGPAWHAVLLGFVFSTAFGHAPAVMPALARTEPRYTPWLRVPAWLLAASLLLRIGASGFRHPVMLAVAGAGHAAAIGWYALFMAQAAWQGRRL